MSGKPCKYLSISKGFNTRGVHAGVNPDDEGTFSALVSPLVLAVTYKQNVPPAGHRGFEYGRTGNPTRRNLETKLASLEETKHCIILPSGMAATNLVFQIVDFGNHFVAQQELYHGSFNLLKNYIAKKAELEFVSVPKLNALRTRVRPDTKFLYLETPTNPTMKLVDLESVITEAKKIAPGIIVVVDNTFMSPYFQRPTMFGADIVMHSCSKYIGGHSDILMGCLCMNDDNLYDRLKAVVIVQGPIASPFDCYLVLRSLPTLGLRMKKHMSNSLAVAKLMEEHPMVETVNHPGLESHPQHKLALSQTSGCSGIMSVYLKGHDPEITAKFMGRLRIVVIADSLGGPESTIKMPSMMPAKSISAEEMKEQGVTHGLVRLSIGIESKEDLLEDFKQALDFIAKN